VDGGIHMPFIIDGGALMRLQMGCWIEGKQMMLMIQFMSEYLAIERPAKRIGHHADEQQKHNRMDMAAHVHGAEIVYPYGGYCQYCFSVIRMMARGGG
jgi:hypothetical protein